LSERRVACITGGTRRVGAHLAAFLASRDYDLVLNYKNDRTEAENTAERLRGQGARVRLVRADVSSKDAVAAMIDSIADAEQRLDVLVHNVGVYTPTDVSELSPAEWDDTLGPNLSGGFYCSYFARPLLEKHGGLIVYLGFAGVDALVANVFATAYQVSKTGLLVLTKSLAKALAPSGIRVNMISPGQMENSVDLEDDSGRIPLGRPGKLDELSHALGFLLDAGYVTGVNIDVAGGHKL